MNDSQRRPRWTVFGLCLSLFAILYGFALGGAFGLAEKGIKAHLNESGLRVLNSVYQGDVAAKDAVVAKSWNYLQRSHLHGGGIGAAGVAVILAMLVLCRPGPISGWAAVAFGGGAILYSIFWLIAGLIAPGLGSTGAAKEALKFIAVPGAGLTLLGLATSIVLIIKDTWITPPSANPIGITSRHSTHEAGMR